MAQGVHLLPIVWPRYCNQEAQCPSFDSRSGDVLAQGCFLFFSLLFFVDGCENLSFLFPCLLCFIPGLRLRVGRLDRLILLFGIIGSRGVLVL
jgi:hypothetical protein